MPACRHIPACRHLPACMHAGIDACMQGGGPAARAPHASLLGFFAYSKTSVRCVFVCALLAIATQMAVKVRIYTFQKVVYMYFIHKHGLKM